VSGYQNLDVSNVTTYSVSSNIAAGTTYYYRVRAYNGNGTSGNSNTINLTTIPPAPTATAASNIQSTSFSANWNASTGATGYRLDVATDSGFSSYVSGYQNLDVSNVTTYSVSSNINPGTTYYYRVRAYNGSGTSGNSNTINLTTTTGPAWWDSNYAYRKQITVTAPASKAVASGYPIKFTFDHASLVNAVPSKSQADGDDIRVVYWNGSSWTELHRILFNDKLNTPSSWSQSNTTIMFKTQAQIAANGSDNGYYLYYGNSSASGPPTNTPSSRYYLAQSLSETQTTDTNYATKVQLQFTPSSTIEHWVVVATWRQRHVGDLGTEMFTGEGRISLNGSPRTGTIDTTYKMSGDVWKTFQAFLKVTNTTSQQTVSIDFSQTCGTDGIDKAQILAFLIPGDVTSADIKYNEALTQVTDTANPTDALTTTFTPSSEGYYIWMVNGFTHEGPGGGTNGGLFAEDETATDQKNSIDSYISGSYGFIPFIHFQRTNNLSTSSKTFTIRHQPDTAGSHRQGLTQLLFRTDVFDEVEVASSTDADSTTSSSYVDKTPALTLTTGTLGSTHDYVYLVSMGLYESGTQAIANSTFGEIRLDGTQKVEDEVAIARGWYKRQVAWAWAESCTGNKTLNARFKA
jgi:hypothetical protein